jgi:tetratricopeptide (TPR) repeat protein
MDAGHTADGRPYLVMEYVEGTAIDVYAADIPLREKLKLFLKVCEAVSYAHRNLIIHRDLKPSNILVDSLGEPKLLDFGIAKILDSTQDQTQTIERLLTPEYASPEQVRGTAQTTATDIYSLGAVLYKLITGHSPHAFGTTKPEDMIASICTKEPALASRSIAGLPRDLDFILAKALRKEPDERYASVDGLGDDVRAFLERRPLRVRSGDVWYRAQKFLRRYWIPVTAAVLVIASLSTGVYTANRQRRVAEQRFRQLRQLSNKVFDVDKAIRDLPGSTQARQSLVSASLEYLEGLASDARGDLDLAEELADAYWRVARIQGVPVGLTLGQFDKAEVSLGKADSLIEAVLTSRPQSKTATYSSALIRTDRAIVAQSEHRNEDALAQALRAVQRWDAFMSLGTATDVQRRSAAESYGNLAVAYRNLKVYDQSVRCARKQVEIARTLPSASDQLSQGLGAIASAMRAKGDLETALENIVEARKVMENTAYQNETKRMFDMYSILWREGMILGAREDVSLDRPADAVEPIRKALDIAEEGARKDPRDYASRSRVAGAARDLGNILRDTDPEQALRVYDLGLRRLAEVANSVVASRDRAVLLAYSSYALRSLQRIPEAKQRIDSAFLSLKNIKQDPFQRADVDLASYTVVRALADYHAAEGQTRDAVEIYEQLIEKMMASKTHPLDDLADANDLSRTYLPLDMLYRLTGNDAKAEEMRAKRLELWRHWIDKLPNSSFVRRQLEKAQLPS